MQSSNGDHLHITATFGHGAAPRAGCNGNRKPTPKHASLGLLGPTIWHIGNSQGCTTCRHVLLVVCGGGARLSSGHGRLLSSRQGHICTNEASTAKAVRSSMPRMLALHRRHHPIGKGSQPARQEVQTNMCRGLPPVHVVTCHSQVVAQLPSLMQTQ